jgi:hypothetical protein
MTLVFKQFCLPAEWSFAAGTRVVSHSRGVCKTGLWFFRADSIIMTRLNQDDR